MLPLREKAPLIANPAGAAVVRMPRRYRRPSYLSAMLRAVLVPAFLLLAALIVAGTMLWALDDLTLDNALASRLEPSVLVETADGQPLARKGPLRLAAAGREDFPDHLVEAVLSIEDRRFFEHFGIDVFGIARALRRNIAAGGIVEGGSTITQQLVKLVLLDDDRTLKRKLREAITAIWLETRLSKDEILTRYLNTIYLGAGAYGVPAAAHLYFGKDTAELTLAESAMMAGLIKAPSELNPLQNPEGARARAAIVLDAMVETGAIEPAEAERAKAEPAVTQQGTVPPESVTWFADWAAEEALEMTRPAPQRIRVRTTLEPVLQALAEETVGEFLAETESGRVPSQAALVALRPDGAVLAMVGGRDYAESQFNRSVQAKRQPGSTFKLFVYLAALRNGFFVDDRIEDAPLEIDGWEPKNFSDRYSGRVTLSDAFVNSLNTATVRLAMEVGIDEVIAAARDLGIDADLPEVPSLALGTAEVSLLDLTGAYASVRAGRRIEPWGIAAFGTEGERRLFSVVPGGSGGEYLGPVRQQMLHLLRGVVERGTGQAAALDGFAAGKTGTSQDYRDAWFIGFNENMTVGVWVGNDDGTPMDEVTGGTLPARIWKRFVEEATPLMADGHPVAGLEMVDADDLTTGSIDPMDPLQAGGFSLRAVSNLPLSEQLGRSGMNRARPLCDIRACEAAYRSFRASDCTFQPYDGPRKLCEKGDVPSRIADAPEVPEPAAASFGEAGFRDLEEGSAEWPPQSPSPLPRVGNDLGGAPAGYCNYEACARAYNSFRPEDCTFQPYRGPRKLCRR